MVSSFGWEANAFVGGIRTGFGGGGAAQEVRSPNNKIRKYIG